MGPLHLRGDDSLMGRVVQLAIRRETRFCYGHDDRTARASTSRRDGEPGAIGTPAPLRAAGAWTAAAGRPGADLGDHRLARPVQRTAGAAALETVHHHC